MKKIPDGWEVVKLGEVISLFHNGIWGTAPLPNEKCYPCIRSTEITYDGKIDLSNVALRKIPEEKVGKYSLQNGDILLVSSSGSPNLIGRAALFKQLNDNKIYLFSNFMLRLRPKNIVPLFLFFLLNTNKYRRFLKTLQQTSTGLRNFPKKDFLKLQIPLPPLPEQERIAEILGTVDEAIEKVGQKIEKTERLKKGLMQKLLTEGIGHKEFKNSEIGRIPKEWKVAGLGENIALEYGKGLTETQRINGQYPVFGSNGIIGYHNEFLVRGPGIIVGRKGTIGAINWSNDNFWPIDTTYFVRLEGDNIDLKWLYYRLSLSNLSKLNMATGTPGLNRELAYSQVIPLPSLPEQKKIAEILSTVDKKLELEKRRKEKLERIKKGLMEELLTGKKRVKV